MYLIVRGEMSVGQFYAYRHQLGQYAAGFSELTSFWAGWKNLQRSMESYFELLDRQPRIPVVGGLELKECRGLIAFEAVDFAYPSRPTHGVLREFSLTVQPGQCVALVGQSGAGKSTAVKLLQRFYDVTGGCLRVDGVDIRELNVRSLRRKIGFVAAATRSC